MRFTTEKHPNLKVKFGRGPLVEFRDGEVEVDGERALALARFADRKPDYGISYDEADLPEADVPDEEPNPVTAADIDALTDDEMLDAFEATFGEDAEPLDTREAMVAALKAAAELPF